MKKIVCFALFKIDNYCDNIIRLQYIFLHISRYPPRMRQRLVRQRQDMLSSDKWSSYISTVSSDLTHKQLDTFRLRHLILRTNNSMRNTESQKICKTVIRKFTILSCCFYFYPERRIWLLLNLSSEFPGPVFISL